MQSRYHTHNLRKAAGLIGTLSSAFKVSSGIATGIYSGLLAVAMGAGAAGGYITSKFSEHSEADADLLGTQFSRAALDSDRKRAEYALYNEIKAAQTTNKDRGIRW